jgi:hypothetical protein
MPRNAFHDRPARDNGAVGEAEPSASFLTSGLPSCIA